MYLQKVISRKTWKKLVFCVFLENRLVTINVPLFKKLRDIIFFLVGQSLYKVIVPPKKNYIQKFLKQRDIGIFMYQSAVVYCCCVLLFVVGCSCVLLCVVASLELFVSRY